MQIEGDSNAQNSRIHGVRQHATPAAIATAAVVAGFVAFQRYAPEGAAALNSNFSSCTDLSLMHIQTVCKVLSRCIRGMIADRFWKRRKQGSVTALMENNLELPQAADLEEPAKLSGLRFCCSAL